MLRNRGIVFGADFPLVLLVLVLLVSCFCAFCSLCLGRRVKISSIDIISRFANLGLVLRSGQRASACGWTGFGAVSSLGATLMQALHWLVSQIMVYGDSYGTMTTHMIL